jgi:hypothetical protein
MLGRALPSVAPSTQHFRSPLHSLFAPHAQKSALSFQPLTHSSEFTCRNISNIFLTLRTLCPKQPGAGVGSPAKNPGVPLTPTKSLSFINVARSSHGICLLQNTHPPTSLESYSFGKQGGGSKLLQSLPIAASGPRQRLHISRQRIQAISPARNSGRGPDSFRYFAFIVASLLCLPDGFCASPGFLLSSPSQGENFRCL